jgi:hypothetical protein
MSNSSKSDRLLELLAARATESLGSDEHAELKRELVAHGLHEDDSFDLAASSLYLAMDEMSHEAMPRHLSEKVRRSAEAYFDQATPRKVTRAAGAHRSSSANRRGLKPRHWVELLVVAASLLAAAIAWMPRGVTPSVEMTLAEQRQQLLASATDSMNIEWAAAGDTTGTDAKGNVVWSPSRQAGFMTFRNLKKNDPSVEQYQLWIFDKDRDERYPVDGGVFDVASDQDETVIAIDPKIHVDEATLFAITVERPGGVVVSDRSRITLVASVNP